MDDIIIGAREADFRGNTGSGESYFVFGTSAGFTSPFNLFNLNDINGIVIGNRSPEEGFGSEVSSVGDFNGDGIDDVIIGAPYADVNGNNDAGRSFIVFGSTDVQGFRSSVINGIEMEGRSGYSVSGAGDFNGDGLDDVVIGAPFADNSTGRSYVVFGTTTQFNSLNLSSLNSSNGLLINGIDDGELSGSSVSSAGDINRDGLDDIIIGAPQAENNTGRSYVVFGSSAGFSSSFELSSLNGSNGFVIHGIEEEDFSGLNVSGAGDINGDEVDDLIIGARFADTDGGENAGESYVVFGNVAPVVTVNNTADFIGSPLDIGNNLNLTDTNSSTLSGAIVTITNLLNGSAETLAEDTTGTEITANYNNGVLTLSGTDTIANYQQVLQSVTYNNNSGSDRDTTDKIVTFQVDDGVTHSNTSNIATTTVTYTLLPDLLPTVFDATEDHVLTGATTVNFTLLNQGNVAAVAFDVQIIYSNNEVIGDGDDVVLETISYDGLEVGDTLVGEVGVSLDVPSLYNNAIIEDTINQGVGYVSNNTDYLGIIIDYGAVISEGNEENNTSQDDITYFPWDLNDDGVVTPTDFVSVVNNLVQSVTDNNRFADLNGDGSITSVDALGVGESTAPLRDRLGYLINEDALL